MIAFFVKVKKPTYVQKLDQLKYIFLINAQNFI